VIILGDKRFIEASFDNEAEIERVVSANAEYIFGADSILLPKSRIRSADGFGTVPDGYAIDFASRRWFIVEAELSSHSVWGHIAPQVAKQLVAAIQPASRERLIDTVVDRIRTDGALKTRIDELGVAEIDIPRILRDIIESPPIVGIPIDHVSTDLRQWAQTLRNEVKLWIVRKLVDFDDPSMVLYEIPDEYRPVLDTSASPLDAQGNDYYNVSISDLIKAGLLVVGQKLRMAYGPRGANRETYTAEVTEDGSLRAGGRSFAASYAALYFIQLAGSRRNTVNGWTTWKTDDGRSLADLREAYLNGRPNS
jgi:RAMA domain-containing protein